MAVAKRTVFGRIADWLFTWTNSLPPESNNYTIQNIRIPLPDGVKLAADLYQPIDRAPIGTILVRTPYGIDLVSALGLARCFAARGYLVLFSSCRGTSDSEGDLEPGRYEVADGHAVVEWMRRQQWYTGSFAMVGGSYLGFVQWAILTDPPADMKTAIVTTGPIDIGHFSWGSGALNPHMVVWADLLTFWQQKPGFLSVMLHLRSQKARLSPALNSVPMLDNVDKVFENKAPAWLRKMVTTPDFTDPCYKSLQFREALDKVEIPVCLVAGWYDPILTDVIEQYTALKERGCKVALTVGPWTHLGAQGRNIPDIGLPWLEEHFAGSTEHREYNARMFIVGAEEWREFGAWPPKSTTHKLFLHGKGVLSKTAPASDNPTSSFTFDPHNPTPTIGVPQAFDRDVKRDINGLCSRSDVLTFTTTPLDEDLEVLGRPGIELQHSSHNPNADIHAVLSEVDSKGSSVFVSEIYMRLDPGRAPGALRLTLSDCAHRFRKGVQIRLVIAGGSHPRHIRNLGSGENPGTGSTLRSVKHMVHHDAEAISSLALPVSVESS